MNSLKARFLLILITIGAVAFTLLTKPTNLGLDLQGGTRLILEAQDTEKTKVDNDSVLGAIEVIRNRIDGLGVSEPIISKKGLRQIIVELPGIKNPDDAIKLIGETALLEFVDAEWAPPGLGNLEPAKQQVILKGGRLDYVRSYDTKGNLVRETPIILRRTLLTGSALKIASPGTDEYGQPVVNLEFTSEGGDNFYKITMKNNGKPLAILLDGEVISAPNINEPIAGGKAVISGNFSISEMKTLVIKLKAGALPVPVEILSNKTVGPSLGHASIEKSKKAGLIGLIFLFVFMVFAYRLPGFLAYISLCLYVFTSLALLNLFGATLTLTGIAGLILTMGMAVDANIIIFERIKEERKNGVAILSSLSNGFSRAFIAILDANVTTLIAAVVLFWLGTGTIKGFAITLSVGILVSMFSAVFVTRTLLEFVTRLFSKNKSILFKG